jgi:hypothetical protein
MRSMVEGASALKIILGVRAPSTILRSRCSLRMVPLPRYRGAG